MSAVALVFAKDGEARTDSRKVAEAFEKPHGDVLRAIDGLVTEEPALAECSFASCSYKPSQGGRPYRCFEMNRDGFALLAMGFTGAKALQFKIAFLKRFNEMEAVLADEVANDDALDAPGHAALPLMTQDDFDLDRTIRGMREIRLAYGVKAAREFGRRRGLGDLAPPASPLPELEAPPVWNELHQSAVDWMRARVEVAPGHRVRSMVLYNDYLDWAKGEKVASHLILTLSGFGRYLSQCGVPSRRSDTVHRVGIRLLSS